MVLEVLLFIYERIILWQKKVSHEEILLVKQQPD